MTVWERLAELRPFLIASYAIAFAQWAVSPPIAPHWWPTDLAFPDVFYIPVTFALSIIWIGALAIGFRMCGSMALLLLGSFYGLYPIWLWGTLYWACARHGACL